jgi:hypothetical protein
VSHIELPGSWRTWRVRPTQAAKNMHRFPRIPTWAAASGLSLVVLASTTVTLAVPAPAAAGPSFAEVGENAITGLGTEIVLGVWWNGCYYVQRGRGQYVYCKLNSAWHKRTNG